METDSPCTASAPPSATGAPELTNFPRELAEVALAHALKDKTEAAYQRGDLFDKRRKMMRAWAGFCMSPPRAPGEVVTLRGGA